MKTIKKIVNFFATIIVFIGGWKFFPENIKATSYGDCVLAAIVFMIAGIFFGVICAFLAYLIVRIHANTSKCRNTDQSVITILVYAILFIVYVPLGILAATYFTPYAIVGKKAFVLLWIVLGIIDISVDSKDESIH